jgi:hypothetical protein
MCRVHVRIKVLGHDSSNTLEMIGEEEHERSDIDGGEEEE